VTDLFTSSGGPTITRVRSIPGGVDQYGDPIPGSEDSLVILGAFVAPRTSEDADGRARPGVIVGLTLFAPYDADIDFGDEFDISGLRWRIDGVPGQWRQPWTGWEAGMSVALVRAEA
jgi:hypothetical protein